VKSVTKESNGLAEISDRIGNKKENLLAKNHFACYLLHVRFLLVLFYDPEDGGDIFLRNVG
jgi:hypothetical protein